ncbi:Trimeric GatFAB AmidoTransferase(AdT) complex subunit [Tieghemiomyces parasiticus]|uniref:Glutamyl-tRNA(Gln) amidotransferase subunit A, mitochondrial n=1 Tax=Tieghemiomyces parasiticus TaxID=78921 RepID=A0A9W8DZ82_9FUNG|nr:Trimeric GatFAB AmidoTransferase(AdT) complex subunit [Tieghemiomyces parasiticus]
MPSATGTTATIRTELTNSGSSLWEQYPALLDPCSPDHNEFRAFVRDSAFKDPSAVADQIAHLKRAFATPSTLRPLAGVLVGVKDNICTAGRPTTCASPVLDQFQSPYDATAVRLLQEAGAIVVGKTNLDEFGMGSLGLFSSHGAVINPVPYLDRKARGDGQGEGPVDPLYSAGGSSSGSAAAVAVGQCDVALGTDTGGSVRLPASYCGVVGFKPSYGRISRWGVVAYANSLDTVGILTRSVQDSRTVYDIIAQADPQDPTALDDPAREQLRTTVMPEDLAEVRTGWSLSNLQGCRVGVPQEYFVKELSDDVTALWRRSMAQLTARGATVVPVSCPHTRYALSSYYILAPAEASSNLARYDGVRYGHGHAVAEGGPDSAHEHASRLPTLGKSISPKTLYGAVRSHGFGPEVQRRILLGTYVLTASAYEDYFLQAQKVRRLVQRDFDHVFRRPNVLRPDSLTSAAAQGVDVLLTPTALSHAPQLPTIPSVGRSAGSSPKGIAMADVNGYVNDIMTVPSSLAGLPAISVPFGRVATDDHGVTLPAGLQLIAQYGDETTLLNVAEALEAVNSDSP